MPESLPLPAERARDLLVSLRAHADPDAVAGMARVGINSAATLGVSGAAVREFAREIKHEAGRGGGPWRHDVAAALWDSGIHEGRLLAALVDEPSLVTEAQLERWVADLDSWDVCDGLMIHLVRRTPFAWEAALAWVERDAPFVKRAGFALVATLAVHDKAVPDERFEALLPLIERHASDSRNEVKKAVNWALRQIGKRSVALLPPALILAERLAASSDPTERWVGRDAARELHGRAEGHH